MVNHLAVEHADAWVCWFGCGAAWRTWEDYCADADADYAPCNTAWQVDAERVDWSGMAVAR